MTRVEPGEPLTARERQVLSLLLKFNSDKEISSELGISKKTTDAHKGSIYRKMRVADRLSLFRLMYDTPTRREISL